MSPPLLYGHPMSANTHRVRLLAGMLGLTVEFRLVDLLKGEHLTPAFAAISAQRRVPVLVDGAVTVRESYAILLYLVQVAGGEARETLWPSDPAAQASVAQWLFFTANELHNGVGLARNEASFGVASGGAWTSQRAKDALKVLEQHLESRDWLELDRPTLAEVAAYPFVAVAPEAGVALDDYPRLSAWIGRLSAVPGFLAMPRLPGAR